MARRSNSRPVTVETATAQGMAAQIGSLSRLEEKQRQHSTQHDKFTLGEVDDAGGVIDDRETDTYQGIDRAGRQAG